MVKVLLGIGSNIDREDNIRRGLNKLSHMFDKLSISPIYETEAVGFDGDDFLNLVASGETEMPLKALADTLRQIEFDHGRPANAKKHSPRHLDIDILTYGELVGDFDNVSLPRDEMLTQAFVLKPLADLEPDMLHPVVKSTYRTLWRELACDSPKAVALDLCLGRLKRSA